MGWDGINYWYWCLRRSKVCSKAHRLPSKAFRQFGQQGYSRKQTPPQSRVYRRVHTDQSDLLYYNILYLQLELNFLLHAYRTHVSKGTLGSDLCLTMSTVQLFCDNILA